MSRKEKHYQIVMHRGQTDKKAAKYLTQDPGKFTGASRLYWTLLVGFNERPFSESKLRTIIQCTPNAVPVRASCMPYDSYRPVFQDQVDFMKKYNLIQEVSS